MPTSAVGVTLLLHSSCDFADYLLLLMFSWIGRLRTSLYVCYKAIRKGNAQVTHDSCCCFPLLRCNMGWWDLLI